MQQANILNNLAGQKGTDQALRQGQFDTEANLVVQRDGKVAQGLTSGEVSSLSTREEFDPRQMGSRAQREKPPQIKKLQEDTKKQQTDKKLNKKKKQAQILDSKKTRRVKIDKTKDTLNTYIDSNIIYKPKTKENKAIYESIITLISKQLPDISSEELKSFTDEILAILKQTNKQDRDKFNEMQVLLPKLQQSLFDQLFQLTKSITDYDVSDNQNEMNVNLIQEENLELIDSDKDIDDEEQQNDVIEGDDESQSSEENYLLNSDDQGIAAKGDIEIEEEEDDQKYYLDVNDIDRFYLQTQLNQCLDDVVQAKSLEPKIMEILKQDDRTCQKQLVEILNFDQFELVQLLNKNRLKIFYAISLAKAQNEQEKELIKEEMNQTAEGAHILEQMQSTKTGQQKELFQQKKQQKQMKREAQGLKQQKQDEEEQSKLNKILMAQDIGDEDFNKISKKYLELENLTFKEGARLMSNQKCTLPPDSFRVQKKGYDEIYVPAVKQKPSSQIQITKDQMPAWTHKAFDQIQQLNYIQSQVYKTALMTSENMLICAPTGAGKTNVALLTMLQEVGKWLKPNGKVDTNKFKIVYISPMKALVAEQVGNFSKRLESYGIKVKELTGDVQLSKKQIDDTQIIISTPEKWDIVTRKAGDKTYTELVKLIIIDEIHLLHDQRGPVLESLVARTIRQIEQTQQMVRIVGLSATLPNYTDVASLIRVKKEGLFYFDSTYRPCPLEQLYIGISEKKAVRKVMLMNEILYDKVIERAGKYQMIIFVHSRRDTAKTAEYLREQAYSKDQLGKFVKEDSDTKKILNHVSENIQNPELKELLPNGFAIHHAGLSRSDRQDVEDLFANKRIQVLVSTATLAWGVNLPAHTVIIKGTQVYSPEEGAWKELSPQDVLQMMGRAGRPGYDTKGEGIILTTYSEMKFYLSVLNQQLPIESQFINLLPDQLNAEIVLGTVTNVKDAVNWLGYTYLYIRMLRNPKLYGITDEELEEDKLLIQRRTNLIHTAAHLLDKNSLIKYDKKTGVFQVTSLGKIASHYYIKYPSIEIYNKQLKSNISMIELFRIFALSTEFKFIPIREEEKGEILKLMESVPIPIKGSSEDYTTKVNILLQAYIGKLSLQGFSINADMIYITQSAGRIIRAIFEICLKRGWAQAAEVALNVCKMVDKRMWTCMTVLRQFKSIPEEILRRIERKEQFTYEHFYNMSSQQIGELIKLPKLGKVLHKLIHQFPKLEVKPYLQPITRSCLRIDVTISIDFQWETKIHGSSEPFWLMVVDCNGEEILYSEYFNIKESVISEQDYVFSFTVPLFENLHPLYYVKVISDRWLQSETCMPISFKNLILPERFSAPTELYDLQLLPVTTLEKQGQEMLQKLNVQQFNQIQTQVYPSFYKNTTDNVFLGAPTGSGKSLCFYLSILATIENPEYTGKKIVYVAPKEELLNNVYEELKLIFGGKTFGKKVAVLQGQLQSDIKILEKYDIIITSAESLDIVTRRWKARKVLMDIKLMIFDEIHLLNENYSVLEVVISRMRLIQSKIAPQTKLQLIGLATSVADYKEISGWLGANSNNTYNFHPNVRPYPIDIIVYPFDQNDRKSRILAMQRYMFQGIKRLAKDKQTIVFISDRKQARITALELVTMQVADNQPQRFLRSQKALNQLLSEVEIKDPIILNILQGGIGLLYEGQDEIERDLIRLLYKQDIIQVLLVTYKLSWELKEHAYFTVILDNQRYDGYEKRYIDYTIPDMFQMIGRSQNKNSEIAAKSLVLCHSPKKDYYKKFLTEPFPVESHLNHYLQNHLCGEIVAKNITNIHDCIDWTTWTFLYWRLSQNPNYYNLLGVSGSQITEYLSELIENTRDELEGMKCIAVEEEVELLPLNLGIISSYYYIHTSSIEMFADYIKDDSKMKQLIQILSNATEFEEVPIRQGEDPLLRNLSYGVEYKFDKNNFNEPQTKTNILLQCHFSRTELSADFRYDQKQVLEKASRLIHAMVDVISSNCWLDQAIKAMQLNQMVIQALWANESTLFQLPYMTRDIVNQLRKKDVNDIEDFLNMEDDDRSEILKHLDEDQIQNIAEVANRYPTVSMQYKIKNDLDSIHAGDIIEIQVIVERDGDEEDYTDYVTASYYPKQKEELWWLICGDKKNNKLHSIKRFSFKQAQKVQLKFEMPEEGEHDLMLYLICDSYIGCDQAEKFQLKVLEGEESEEDADEE